MDQSPSNSVAENSHTVTSIQAWFTAQIAEKLGLDPNDLDPNLPFDSFGLDSVQALNIARQAEQFLGIQLSPVLLWHYPTIASLSERLIEDIAETTTSDEALLSKVDQSTLEQMLLEVEQLPPYGQG